ARERHKAEAAAEAGELRNKLIKSGVRWLSTYHVMFWCLSGKKCLARRRLHKPAQRTAHDTVRYKK
ncbi:MAG: hypothetical protein ACXW2U_20505, partial [Telluria sp.]